MRDKLISVIEHYAFLRPESTTTSTIHYSYVTNADLAAVVAASNFERVELKLKSYQLSMFYTEKNLEDVILSNLYQQFNSYTDIYDIRDAGIFNIDCRAIAAEKLDRYLLRFYARAYYFPDMMIISQTLYEYIFTSKHFNPIVYRNRPNFRLTLEGEYRRANVYVDWFAKEDFIYIGCNKTASLRLFYSLEKIERNEMDLIVWRSNTFDQCFYSVLAKNARDPMEANMLYKDVKEFFPE